MNLLKTLSILPLAVVFSLPAYAHPGHDDSRFDKRFDRQHERIKAGIQSGELTKKEAGKLKKQQRKNEKLERKFSADGYLSRKERKTLEKKQDKASQKIRRLKHNDRVVTKPSHHKGYHQGHFHHKKPFYGYKRPSYHGLNDHGGFIVFNLRDYF